MIVMVYEFTFDYVMLTERVKFLVNVNTVDCVLEFIVYIDANFVFWERCDYVVHVFI